MKLSSYWSLLGFALFRCVTTFSPAVHHHNLMRIQPQQRPNPLHSTNSQEDVTPPSAPPAPVLNGKRVLPYTILMNGIRHQQQRIAAVYGTLHSGYRRGTDGWDAVTHVGVTQDLVTTLQGLHANDPTEMQVAHVRALSFAFPQPNAMQDVALSWREQAMEAGAVMEKDGWVDSVLNHLFDEEDDDEDDDVEEYMEMAADAMAATTTSTTTIVSPFESDTAAAAAKKTDDETPVMALEFTAENVDTVLNEVRPYLIADGGNVKVERVDPDQQLVELQLEGACGSCASSTVTMQMGIERVLKEKWPGVTVSQVDSDDNNGPKELTWMEVQKEVDRMKQALIAMGAVVELLSVDSETGIVEMRFRGAERVRQGLELAILDVSFVNKVVFVEENN